MNWIGRRQQEKKHCKRYYIVNHYLITQYPHHCIQALQAEACLIDITKKHAESQTQLHYSVKVRDTALKEVEELRIILGVVEEELDKSNAELSECTRTKDKLEKVLVVQREAVKLEKERLGKELDDTLGKLHELKVKQQAELQRLHQELQVEREHGIEKERLQKALHDMLQEHKRAQQEELFKLNKELQKERELSIEKDRRAKELDDTVGALRDYKLVQQGELFKLGKELQAEKDQRAEKDRVISELEDTLGSLREHKTMQKEEVYRLNQELQAEREQRRIQIDREEMLLLQLSQKNDIISRLEQEVDVYSSAEEELEMEAKSLQVQLEDIRRRYARLTQQPAASKYHNATKPNNEHEGNDSNFLSKHGFQDRGILDFSVLTPDSNPLEDYLSPSITVKGPKSHISNVMRASCVEMRKLKDECEKMYANLVKLEQGRELDHQMYQKKIEDMQRELDAARQREEDDRYNEVVEMQLKLSKVYANINAHTCLYPIIITNAMSQLELNKRQVEEERALRCKLEEELQMQDQKHIELQQRIFELETKVFILRVRRKTNYIS